MATFDGVHGTVCNGEQYSRSQALRDHGNYTSPSISCLTHGESIGLALAAEASLISFTSVIVIFTLIGWNVRWYRKKFRNGDWKLFREPADIYMFSLFVFEFLQSIGGILNIKWAHNGIVTDGHYCTAQGLIEQIGDLGVALSTLFLAVHTFVTAVLPEQVGLNARAIALSLVCFTCLFITLWVSIGASVHRNYETPTPYWCWISPQFSPERLGGEYIWMWIALFTSAILYIPLYFWAEGYWSIDNNYKFHWSKADKRVSHAQRRATLGLLLYPLGYSFVILPLSIARWSQFSNHHVSSAATFFTVSMFYLSGAINVLLFLIIRPQLLLFPRPETSAEPDIEIVHQGTSPTISPDIPIVQHSPEPTSVALAVGDSRNTAALSPVGSRRMSDEISI